MRRRGRKWAIRLHLDHRQQAGRGPAVQLLHASRFSTRTRTTRDRVPGAAFPPARRPGTRNTWPTPCPPREAGVEAPRRFGVMGSASGGVLRVNDTGTASGDKVKWWRGWDVTNTRGGTVLVRARCDSYDPGGAGITAMGNLLIEDGKYQESSLFSRTHPRQPGQHRGPVDGRRLAHLPHHHPGWQFKVLRRRGNHARVAGQPLRTTSRLA